MNKNVFKSIQKSMIGSTFLDFYFPDSIEHAFIAELKKFQNNATQYRQLLFNSTTETELKMIAVELKEHIKILDKLSKEDFPNVNYFFNITYKNSFNFDYMKEVCEQNYASLSFLEKFQLSIALTIPEHYTPSEEIKKTILEDFGFQYLHLPATELSNFKTEAALKNFITQTKNLMGKMNKPLKSISIHGEIGLMLDNDMPIYGHLAKCMGITKDINSQSILHEFTHAVDNYVFHKLTGINDYASENFNDFIVKDSNFLPVYINIKQALFKVCNMGVEKPGNIHEIVSYKPSFYYINCCAADEDLFITRSEYYKKPCEILARMVEAGEYPKETETINKSFSNLVFLNTTQNPYSTIKDILFSVVDKPLNNITKLRHKYDVLPQSSNKLPISGKLKV